MKKKIPPTMKRRAGNEKEIFSTTVWKQARGKFGMCVCMCIYIKAFLLNEERKKIVSDFSFIVAEVETTCQKHTLNDGRLPLLITPH